MTIRHFGEETGKEKNPLFPSRSRVAIRPEEIPCRTDHVSRRMCISLSRLKVFGGRWHDSLRHQAGRGLPCGVVTENRVNAGVKIGVAAVSAVEPEDRLIKGAVFRNDWPQVVSRGVGVPCCWWWHQRR